MTAIADYALGAGDQPQLDSYGHLLEQSWTWAQFGPDDDQWRFLHALVDAAAERWTEPDRGIWEWRGEPRRTALDGRPRRDRRAVDGLLRRYDADDGMPPEGAFPLVLTHLSHIHATLALEAAAR